MSADDVRVAGSAGISQRAVAGLHRSDLREEGWAAPGLRHHRTEIAHPCGASVVFLNSLKNVIFLQRLQLVIPGRSVGQ
jgi:hypothetical protein